MTAPDRWHRLRDAVVASNLPASDRAYARFMLDRADYGTAELPARFTPTQQEIARATGLSLRQVKYSATHLARHGWLTVKGPTGPGRTLEYRLDIGEPCDCPGRRHTAAERVQPDQGTGAAVAPERVQRTGATPQARPQISLRGTEREGMGGRPDRDRWPPGTNGAEMNPWPSARIPAVRGPTPADPGTREALRVLAETLGPIEILKAE